MTMKLAFFFFAIILLIVNCKPQQNKDEQVTKIRPNILFAIADDISYPHMGAYGCTWVNTPAFDRVADQGILFTNAYTPNAKCAPSRASILTGRNSWQLEEAGNHWPYYPDKFITYAEVLADNDYHVGYTAKGFAPGKPAKHRQLTGKPYNEHKLEPPTQHISNNDYASNFAQFLQEKPGDQPFCFWYGSLEPHRRYEFGSSLANGKRLTEIDKVPSFWPENDSVRTDMLDYAFEIEYFDHHLQKMLALLEEKGQLDNTIVIVTADNGMPFPRVKANNYEYSNHLPLAIMWPDGIANPGRTVTDFVSFIDFAPTFLELANIQSNKNNMQPITGKSLTEIFFNEKSGRINPERNYVLIGKERHDIGRPNDVGYPVRGIVTDKYLYIHNFEPDRWPAGNPETGYLATDGGATKTVILNQRRSGENEHFWQLNFGKRPQEELYLIAEDSECINNLAFDMDYQNEMKQLKEQLFEKLKKQNDPRMAGNGEIFDEYAYANDNGRNFYQRYMQGDSTLNWGWVNDSDFEKAPIQ